MQNGAAFNSQTKYRSRISPESVNIPKQNIEPDKEDDEHFTINKENINPGEEVTDDEGK